MDKPIDPDLIEAIRRNECVLVMGSEISEFSGLPNLLDIFQEPAKEIGIDTNTLQPQVVAEYYSKTHLKASGILKKLIKKRLEIQSAYKDNHIMIKDLPFQVIIVSSYDTLVESAFEAPPKLKYNKIEIENGLSNWENDIRQVVKVFGSVDNPETMILTKSEIDNFSANYPRIIQKLKTLALENSFLFIGFKKGAYELSWFQKELGLEIKKSGKPSFLVSGEYLPDETSLLENNNLRIIDTGSNTTPYVLTSFFRRLSDQVKGLTFEISREEKYKSGPVQTLAEQEKQAIIDRLMTTRLGSYLSLRVDPKAVDKSHHYELIAREDLLNYEQGDFYSIRTLYGVNVSEVLSSYVMYSESSEVKLTFDDCGILAMNPDTGEPLVVEAVENGVNELKFTHAFKIYFPYPIAPGEKFKISYSIRLPGELRALSQRGDAMSISLARVMQGVDELHFSVVLNKKPRTYWVEELTYQNIRGIIPLRPQLEQLAKNYKLDWPEDNAYRISCKWEKPSAIAYFINYRFS